MEDRTDGTDASLAEAAYILDPPDTVWEGVLTIDHATWLEVEDLEVVRRANERVERYGHGITREAWLGLYASMNPLKRTPPEGMEVAHGIFGRAERMPEWTSLRASVVADEIAAAFGAAHFAGELIDRLPPEIKERMERARRAQDDLRELRTRADALRMLAGIGGAQPGESSDARGRIEADLQGSGAAEDREDLARIEAEIQKAESEARLRAQEALSEMSDAEARIARAMAEGLAAAAGSLSDLKHAAQAFGFGWGLGGGGRPTREEVEGLHDLAQRLKRSDHLKRILDVLGWAQRMVSVERRKSKRGRESFTHYQVQALDLETIAPEELVGWMDPDRDSPLWLDFLRRSLDGELLHRRYEGEDEVGRGPFVILIDKSGSMRGRPNATACAFELALMKLAVEGNRRFLSIPFSDVGQYQVYDPGPRPDPKRLVEHLELFYGHGTEPYDPLTKAVELVRTDPSMKEGDILIITDGAFGPPPAPFLELLSEAREEPGLKVVAVVVRGHPGQAEFADEVVLVEDLVGERERLAGAIAPLI